jgi:hypothetical protein
MGRD